jgi:hypothetical protein
MFGASWASLLRVRDLGGEVDGLVGTAIQYVER